MRRLLSCCALILTLVSPGLTQFNYPGSSSTLQYFLQLADGGAPQKWRTTLMAANPDPVNATTITFAFYDNEGLPLALNFGEGAATTLVVTVPAAGVRLMTSAGASRDLVQGWATGTSNYPFYGTVIYQATENDVPHWDVAAAGTGPTFLYDSLATYWLGVAIVNPSATQTVSLRVVARNQAGADVGSWDTTLDPREHTVFNLGPQIPGIPPGFTGRLTISARDNPPRPFAAWSLYSRDGLLSPLPVGEMRQPAPYDRKPRDILATMKAAAVSLVSSLGPSLYGKSPEEIMGYVNPKGLVVDPGVPLSARYQAADDSVHISQGLLETLGGSDAALAFVIAHYVARGVLETTGLPPVGLGAGRDIETVSDIVALGELLAAGYDPGGLADFYGRAAVAMVQGLTLDATFRNEFAGVVQEEVGDRIAEVWTALIQGCDAMPDQGQICDKAHRYWHPNYPANVP